ncbi:MAG: hypothetical protein BGP12_05820 [Rhodospirillales bacterium 70-18]|nr:GNAT family N-acetyltransferase [Rhodospirillales bacterium]OJY76951.1 MAG: hypothetical protein BGP12_05820 [Rhodospirillales bacterium 70-18]
MDTPSPPAPPIPDLLIRAAAPEDAAAIAAMQALPGFRFGTLRLPYPRIEDVRRRLAGLGEAEHMLLAVAEGAVVGALGLRRRGGRQAHAGEIGMGIHDAWTGRRVGTRLLAAAIELADDWLGLRRLELAVYTDNAPALALYRRAGFVHEGTHRAYALRAGRLVDAHFLARLVGDPYGTE